VAATGNIARGNQGKQLRLVSRALAYVAVDVNRKIDELLGLWDYGFIGL